MNRFTKTSVIFLATIFMLIISPALMSQMAQETIACYCVDPTLMTDKPGATFGSFAEAQQACMIEGERWETNGYLSGSLVTTYVRPFSQQVTDPDIAIFVEIGWAISTVRTWPPRTEQQE